MRYKLIELVALDENGCESRRWDYDTVKEAKVQARRWVHPVHGPNHWDQAAEVVGYHKDIYTVQLIADGEILYDWFPSFFVSTKPVVVEEE